MHLENLDNCAFKKLNLENLFEMISVNCHLDFFDACSHFCLFVVSS